MESIKIASFNLKRDSIFSRANFKWQNRREMIQQLIEQSGASIIGVQELMPAMREDIRHLLRGYSVFGLGRARKLGDEHAAILVKNKENWVGYDKTFWLSKHPEKSGSRALLAIFPRVCTVCEVYVEQFGRRIRVFNTHFDHISGFARNLSVRIILEYMHNLNQIEKLPCILMGDLNAKPGSRPIRILTENLHLYDDINLTNVYNRFAQGTIRNTYHGFKGIHKPEPIDYIFVSEEFLVDEAYIDTTCVNGQYPSDHFPLVARLHLADL